MLQSILSCRSMFLGKSCEIWGLSLSPIEDLNHLDSIYPSSQHHGSVEYHPADKEASLGYIPFSTDPMIGERYSFFHMGSVENDQKDAPFSSGSLVHFPMVSKSPRPIRHRFFLGAGRQGSLLGTLSRRFKHLHWCWIFKGQDVFCLFADF